MRHAKAGLQFNRFTSWRAATLKSLARSILVYQSIKTTKVRAKAVKPLVEKLISLAKENSLAAKRQANRILNDHQLVSLLFNEIGPRFANRASGFTRILDIGKRRGDNAEIVILELTEIKKKEPKKIKKEEKSKEEPVSGQPHEHEHPHAEKEKPAPHKHAPEEKEKPGSEKKPPKKFLGGIRGIFKKERDSL
ncbi:MAG: 50S ribosomal protein L17 [Candidatus Omnitrophica bacterium]|nr:50S ribosomal protein L17 [Candidatus Omnitrophota bacterium]MDD5653015.1 50S ribosomal protein L17 [Candidatus Omnitrophota bacterium]